MRANRCGSLELLSSRRLQFASRSLFMFVLSEKYVLPASDKPSPRCFSVFFSPSRRSLDVNMRRFRCRSLESQAAQEKDSKTFPSSRSWKNDSDQFLSGGERNHLSFQKKSQLGKRALRSFGKIYYQKKKSKKVLLCLKSKMI